MKLPDGWQDTRITTPDGEVRVFRKDPITLDAVRILDFYGPNPSAGLVFEYDDYQRRRAELEAKK